jgi:hypothetical protein
MWAFSRTVDTSHFRWLMKVDLGEYDEHIKQCCLRERQCENEYETRVSIYPRGVDGQVVLARGMAEEHVREDFNEWMCGQQP